MAIWRKVLSLRYCFFHVNNCTDQEALAGAVDIHNSPQINNGFQYHVELTIKYLHWQFWRKLTHKRWKTQPGTQYREYENSGCLKSMSHNIKYIKNTLMTSNIDELEERTTKNTNSLLLDRPAVTSFPSISFLMKPCSCRWNWYALGHPRVILGQN